MNRCGEARAVVRDVLYAAELAVKGLGLAAQLAADRLAGLLVRLAGEVAPGKDRDAPR